MNVAVLVLTSLSLTSAEKIVSTNASAHDVETAFRLQPTIEVDDDEAVVEVRRERQCARETRIVEDVVEVAHNDWALPAAITLGAVGVVAAGVGGGALLFPPTPTTVEVVDESGTPRDVAQVSEEAERQHFAVVFGGLGGGVVLIGLGAIALLLEDVPGEPTQRTRVERSEVACAPTTAVGVEVVFNIGGSTFRKVTDSDGRARVPLAVAKGYFSTVDADVDDNQGHIKTVSGSVPPSAFFARLRNASDASEFGAFRSAFPEAIVPESVGARAEELQLQERQREEADRRQRRVEAEDAEKARVADEQREQAAIVWAKLVEDERRRCRVTPQLLGDGSTWAETRGFVGQSRALNPRTGNLVVTGAFSGKGLRWSTSDGKPAFELGDVQLEVDPSGNVGGGDLHQALLRDTFRKKLTLFGTCADAICRSGTLTVLGRDVGTFDIAAEVLEAWTASDTALRKPLCSTRFRMALDGRGAGLSLNGTIEFMPWSLLPQLLADTANDRAGR